MFYAYTYDDVLYSLVTSVKDAYGYTSGTVYDYKWGVPTETTNLNGQKMRYTYDDMGRPVEKPLYFEMKKYFLDFIVAIICTILFLVYSLIDYINNYLVFLPNIPESYFSEKKWKKKLRRFYKNKNG